MAPPAEDRALVRRILAGDAAAEDELVNRYRRGLLAIARVRVGTLDAEDLVQDTMTAALVEIRRGDWKGQGPLAAYLSAILRRTIARALSAPACRLSEHGVEDLPAGGFDPETVARGVEARELVQAALKALPSRHRDVLLGYYFEGKTVEEVAQTIGVPRGTVLSRLHYARRALSKTMNRMARLPHYSRGGRGR